MNEVLHSVVNKGSGFSSLAFPMRSSFVPEINPVAARVRDFLGFNRTDTDYFVLCALQILHSYPDLLCRFREQERSYDLELYRPARLQCGGAQLVAYGATPPRFRRRPAEWPPAFEASLTVVDGSHADLRHGAETVSVACARGAELVQVAWPEDSGIAGALRAVDWTPSQVIHISGEPYGYPYELVASELLLLDDAQELLQRSDAWESFVSAITPHRQIAILLAAIGLNNTSVYGPR